MSTFKKAILQLHVFVFLAGLTGPLGYLIQLNGILLVFYRMLITSLILWGLYLIRKNNGLAINELETFRKKNQSIIKDKVYESNTNLMDSLPSYISVAYYIDGLLKDEKYVHYVINYLLLHCQVRNADLIFDFVLFYNCC